VGVPDLDHLDKTDLNKKSRYQLRLREDLRKRFRFEYLSQLVQWPGTRGTHQDIQVGDVVLIESEGKGRTFWPMARVMEAYPGRNGYVRVVRLKTAVWEMVRPVPVYPLKVKTPAQVPELKEQQTPDDVSSTSSVLRKTVTTRSGRQVKLPSKYLNWGCIVWLICTTINQRWEDVRNHS
jgi:hypothetical protein